MMVQRRSDAHSRKVGDVRRARDGTDSAVNEPHIALAVALDRAAEHLEDLRHRLDGDDRGLAKGTGHEQREESEVCTDVDDNGVFTETNPVSGVHVVLGGALL